LQGFFLQIDIPQITIHKADQSDIVVNFFDADRLSGEYLAEIDLFTPQTDSAATGDHDGLVVERVVAVGQPLKQSEGPG
jgi:hypothetical protein